MLINFTLKKVRLFSRYKDKLNDRQVKVLQRMLEDGPHGFEGGMNARKYSIMTRASKSTVTRDLQELVALGLFSVKSGGCSMRYILHL